jgi:uncharacterized protein YegL
MNLINHVVFVVDRSGSMSGRQSETIKVFDNEIKKLAKDSKTFNQETRVSVFLFGSEVECVIYDTDVLRLPSLASLYKTEGMTKLIDATLLAIDDLEQVPTKYGDHAFLFYVLTDGQENDSDNNSDTLKWTISSLPDNWTFAAFVPNRVDIGRTCRYGFPVDNISAWSTASGGITKVGNKIRSSSSAYMQARSKGIRGTKSLFTLDLSNLTKSNVLRNLTPIPINSYKVWLIKEDVPIKDFVESQGCTYYKGQGFYQLTKRVKVQSYKQIYVRDRNNGGIFGGENARALLGLPTKDITLIPDSHPDFDIFIESTSVNRKLLKGTLFLYICS